MAPRQRGKEMILIYGGSGLVGSELVKTLTKEFKIVAPSHKDLDLTQLHEIRDYIEAVAPDQIIYAAGVTKIVEAEQQPKQAFLLNAEAPKIIAEFAAPRRIPVHFLSTNAVFDGQQSHRPYREDEKPSPLSVYGKTKVRGEEYVIHASPLNSVLRTVMPYSTFYQRKKDFTRMVVESLRQGKQVEGIVDQMINPIYVKTLAHAIKMILMNRANGIYHLAATDWMSNYEFAKKVARVFGISEKLIIPTTLEKFYQGTSRGRTPYYWLDTKKFRRDFGNRMLRTIDKDLALFKKDYSLFRRSTNTDTREATSKA